MTPAQCRAARALINMSQAELARGGVPVTTIADYETSLTKCARSGKRRAILRASG